jgi:hypothetical protein
MLINPGMHISSSEAKCALIMCVFLAIVIVARSRRILAAQTTGRHATSKTRGMRIIDVVTAEQVILPGLAAATAAVVGVILHNYTNNPQSEIVAGFMSTALALVLLAFGCPAFRRKCYLRVGELLSATATSIVMGTAAFWFAAQHDHSLNWWLHDLYVVDNWAMWIAQGAFLICLVVRSQAFLRTNAR